ncbi:hypothetical protein B0J14DRAFT_604483 [Halenospora varia]|nr:hypothetical protein B0J14DRAFT_604483 [Halenospora varia]
MPNPGYSQAPYGAGSYQFESFPGLGALSVDDSSHGKYRLVKALKKGGYGEVSKVQLISNPVQVYARKEIEIGDEDLENLQRESNLIYVKHLHVVKFIGDLADYLQRKTATDLGSWEKVGPQRWQLFQWMCCLITALNDLHNRGIRSSRHQTWQYPGAWYKYLVHGLWHFLLQQSDYSGRIHHSGKDEEIHASRECKPGTNWQSWGHIPSRGGVSRDDLSGFLSIAER